MQHIKQPLNVTSLLGQVCLFFPKQFSVDTMRMQKEIACKEKSIENERMSQIFCIPVNVFE